MCQSKQSNPNATLIHIKEVLRQPAKMLMKTKDCYRINMQQLPHLCRSLIIVANLLSFSKLNMVHAISLGTPYEQHMSAPIASTLLPLPNGPQLGTTMSTTTQKANMLLNVFDSATGNTATDETTKDHNGQWDVYDGKGVPAPNTAMPNTQLNEIERETIPLYSSDSNNLANLTRMLTANTPTTTATVSSLTMVLHRTKRFTTETPISALPSASAASNADVTSNLDFNHNSTAAGASSEDAANFHEDCLANRNSLAHVFTVALYSVVCVVGLCGNTLVIWVVFRFSKMQTVTNIYILNLAIADECFLIGIPFLLYTMRICSWKFGEYVCKAYMVSTSITQFTSSIFLLIMAADRYIAVCHPIESPKYRTLRIAKLVSMLAWITSAILMLPVILFASTIEQEDGINFSCNIDWPEVYKKHSGTTFILYTFLLGFATPLCFILVFYYLVIRKLHTVQQKHKSKEKKRSHRKVTRLVLTVITVYILCWLPHWISQVSLINSFVGHRELTRVEILLFLLFGCLAYSNSAMNPILYAFLSDNFRKSFSKAFSCMASQEVEAQLVNEHSVFTHKRAGSAGSRRKGSRRLSIPKDTQAIQDNSFLAPTVVHNSGGGSSSATSASTATTATDKSSNSNNKQKKDMNGVICATTKDGEKITLVVNHESCGGERHKQDGLENQTDV